MLGILRLIANDYIKQPRRAVRTLPTFGCQCGRRACDECRVKGQLLRRNARKAKQARVYSRGIARDQQSLAGLRDSAYLAERFYRPAS
jgi:ribosomal protein S13